MDDIARQKEETVMITDTPGRLLCEAREKLGLTVADIAKRLCLEDSIIADIENDDYHNISAAIYVTGYLRSYSKELGLDGDYIVSLYKSDRVPSLPAILTQVQSHSQVSSKDKPVKVFTCLIVLALSLLLLIWYKSNFHSTDAVNSAAINFDVVIHPEGWRFPVTEPQSGILQNAYTETTASAAFSTKEQPGILPVVTTEETTPTNTSAKSDKIDLVINKDSWVEIYDANNKMLFTGMCKEGEKLQLQGTAPFSLILGYSPGVIVKFNNEIFDTEPYSNKNVARFRLPPEQ